MDTLINWGNSLPPLQEFVPPASPEAYIALLTIFQYFPLVTFIQLATPFYPQGKTSLPSSRLNFPGRYAWVCMESVGALNIMYTLYTGTSKFPQGQLPIWHKTVACLYVLHYLNRAVITPLFLAPSMSPIHLIIIFSAMGFNYLNSSCIAGWLLGYGTPILGSTAPQPQQTRLSRSSSFSAKYFPAEYIPYIGLCLFLIGMYGNIKAEGTLFRLRREEVDNNKNNNKLTVAQNSKNKYDKVYVLPPPTGCIDNGRARELGPEVLIPYRINRVGEMSPITCWILLCRTGGIRAPFSIPKNQFPRIQSPESSNG
ncbi:conserved hypothetical protein [Histoplasma capsulatum H143]|uniref:Steroid 5-alpha reductase C-terminal domain-containing protein n=1 Tax=Ajellomyces capsulatus (strain H143) TaxID=544712 RepID=C6H888_AJECH|nr:conserved hypothetical protein [Histoplasma capsulatum H143]